MIDELGEDGLMEVLETKENTILKEIVLLKGVKTGWNGDEQLSIRAKQDLDFVRWSQIEQNGIKPD